jgi:hypothetical protein
VRSHLPGGLPPAWASGFRQGVLCGAAVLVLTVPPVGLAGYRTARPGSTHASPAATVAHAPDFGGRGSSPQARWVAGWVARSGDNAGAPFAILDKRDARVYVVDSGARLVGSSPVLLGAATGDESVAGIGQRPVAQVRPEERTTPAGRFISQPGPNAAGEDVVWVDYGAAVSMHRVRPVDPAERRLERLASNDPTQRRISYGCINVPVAFFESVIVPLLGKQRGVVYVLPETRPAQAWFEKPETALAHL